MKRILVVALAILLLFSSSTNTLCSLAYASSDLRSGEIPEGLEISGTSARASTVYKTIILQGNTEYASDCQAFENALRNTGFGYTDFARGGWVITSSIPLENRATEGMLKYAYHYQVAYYSGHGSKKTGYPVLNAIPSNEDLNFGTSSPIDVATVLRIASDDNWESECYFTESDPIRVLILAACDQLDSSIVKYYARLMKASGIRAIAGYHGTAPSIVDATIAQNFVAEAAAGNSIKYSWSAANSGQPWAVLVYQENYNEYYRLPGFPGNTYADPSSSASVYRYANFLSAPREETTSIDNDLTQMIIALPLTITAVETESTYNSNSSGNEVEKVTSALSVSDNVNLVESYINSTFGSDALESKVCVQHYVSCTEVDENYGILEDTEAIVERTYDYYDTYNDVKIADSYISVSIDIDGISNASDHRVNVISEGLSICEMANTSTSNSSVISVNEAMKIALSQVHCCDDVELYDVSLAYVPEENGIYTLCYEIMFSCGFYYVDVLNGEIIHLL